MRSPVRRRGRCPDLAKLSYSPRRLRASPLRPELPLNLGLAGRHYAPLCRRRRCSRPPTSPVRCAADSRPSARKLRACHARDLRQPRRRALTEHPAPDTVLSRAKLGAQGGLDFLSVHWGNLTLPGRIAPRGRRECRGQTPGCSGSSDLVATQGMRTAVASIAVHQIKDNPRPPGTDQEIPRYRPDQRRRLSPVSHYAKSNQ